MQACAKACRSCAESCRKMAAFAVRARHTASMGMLERRRVLWVVVLSVVVAWCSVRLIGVRQEFGEWGLWPSSTPPKIPVAGRDYHRGAPAVRPAGWRVIATVANSEPVWAPGGFAGTPTVVVVATPGGNVNYALSGGP